MKVCYLAAWHLASKTPFQLFLEVFNGCEMDVHRVERLKMGLVLVFDSSWTLPLLRASGGRGGDLGGEGEAHGGDHGENLDAERL